jgi:hypothetical protein
VDETIRKDLEAYVKAGSNFAEYVKANYDSSADYWELVKDKKGKWGWEPDGSLDFNFDLNDKEIRKAFFSVFRENIGIANITGDIGNIDFGDMTHEKRFMLGFALGIKDSPGTKYFSKPGSPIGNIALDKFVDDTENKLLESLSRNYAINTYIYNVSQLQGDGVKYGTENEVKNSNGIVIGSSTTMDCTALISYLTQTTRTNTASFGSHNSFKKSTVKMPGDVLIYSAINSSGKRDNHAVIWLGGDRIVESAYDIGPRESTLNKLEGYYTNKGYTFTKQSYGLNRYKAEGR